MAAVIDAFGGLALWMASVGLPFVLALSIVVFVHEYGHYIVGRWCGVHADAFSIGFGPEIAGWTDSRGTRWRVSWIPLGGYVMFRQEGDKPPPRRLKAERPGRRKVRAAARRVRAETRIGPAPRRALRGRLKVLVPPWPAPGSLRAATLGQRSWTVFAGPAANFVFSILVFAALGYLGGKPSTDPVIADVTPIGQAADAGLRDGDRVLTIDGAPVETFSGFVDEMLGAAGAPREVTILRDGREETLVFSLIETPRVGRVQPGSAAAVACLEPGDVVMKVEDLPIATFTQLREAIVASEGAPLRLSVARGGDIVETRITPRMTERPNPLTGEVTRVYMIGVAADMQLGFGRSMAPIGFFEAVWFGVERTWLVISSTLGYIGAWIGGEADGSSIGGPLGIAQASGMAASQGVLAFIGLIATLSTAIGFMNLFPIPILDGGHLVLYAIEAIRGRALAEQWMEFGARIGLAALLALLVFATYNDVSKGAVSLSAC